MGRAHRDLSPKAVSGTPGIFENHHQPLAYTALPFWLLQEHRWGLLLSDGIGHQLDATFWADLLPEVRAVSNMS